MNPVRPLGPLMHSFFVDHLVAVKGLRPASVRSYRDTMRLLLCFLAKEKGAKITKLGLDDLTFEVVLGFLRYLEVDRGNHVRTRNQRLSVLHGLFDYIAIREPEMLGVCQRVAAIPMKRSAPAETRSSNTTRWRTCSAAFPGRAAWRCVTKCSYCSSTTRALGPRGRRPSSRAPPAR